MAEVRRAATSGSAATVAIKRLRADLASDPTFQARFRREAQSAASLNHPAIVAVYDTGEEPRPTDRRHRAVHRDGVRRGPDAARRAARRPAHACPSAPWRSPPACSSALDYSHRAGIIHRDIKPANVMLTPAGDVKVMDFGIARAIADTSATMTQTAAVIGTAQYLSPEQARGEQVDARSDLYSTGCLLYELLTGRPPFVGDSPVSVAYQHVREEPLPPSPFDPDIPPDVDAIVLKALAKSPRDRYQSASEMRADIDRVLAGQQVTAPMAPVAAMSETRAMAPTAVAAAARPRRTGSPGTTTCCPRARRPRRSGLPVPANRGLASARPGHRAVAVGATPWSPTSATTTVGLRRPTPRRRRSPYPDVSGKSVADATALLADQG